MTNQICTECGRGCKEEETCAALKTLYKVYDGLRTEEKTGIIRNLRKYLNLVDCEVADDLKALGDKLIQALPELHIIKDFDVKIGYVRSYEAKRDKGRQVNADCRKVRGTYTAYLPFDFIVTFYEPNIYYLTENQKKVLMLHELRHIGIGERGLRIEPHSVEDFKDILYRFGIEWNGFNQEIPDILAGGDHGKAGQQKTNQKGKKKQGLAASRKTD